uniref:TGF-beta family profile domain-containing protein n=1 Tax=Electrophorus electricus TaxID=8005 RepID=A0AAY5F4P3_ELEEL
NHCLFLVVPLLRHVKVHSNVPMSFSRLESERSVFRRCKRETLQSVRKVILDSLSLQAEPHVSVPGMTCLRDQWKAVFEGPGRAIPLSSEPLSPGNSTAPMCCKLTSQIFIRDLGWDQWIIYPESFTYTRCSPCDPRMDPSNLFSACMLMSSFLQMPCCESTYYELLPFLYLDATSALVITSVPMTRECGCRPVTLASNKQPENKYS